MPKTPLYCAWRDMHRRCKDTQHEDYKNYGGRGIHICARWSSYALFAADMAPHPGKGWSLDREKNNQGYRRGNCRWATQKTQQRNKRVNKLTLAQALVIRTEPGSSRVLGRKYGVDQKMILGIKNGRYWN